MTGPPVILIPGMLCDEETWIDIAPALGAHSLPPLTRPTIAGMADEVLDTAPNTFVLAGLSLGAIVGFEILRRAPHRVIGFCAISTNASAPTPHQLSAWRSHAARTVAGDFETIVREDIAPTMFADAVRAVHRSSGSSRWHVGSDRQRSARNWPPSRLDPTHSHI